MSIKPNFSRLLAPIRQCRPPARRRRSPGPVPGVERLEGRVLLSSYSAGSASALIRDIAAANKTPDADTITLKAGATYTLTTVDNTAHGTTGLPMIAAGGGGLTIVGGGAVIQRNAGAKTPSFRLFDVDAGASLTLTNLTLQGGLEAAPTTGFTAASAQGGAVYSQGTLTLNAVTVQGNSAVGFDGATVWGSGVTAAGFNAAGGGVYSAGALTMTGCTVAHNSATGGRGQDGFVYGTDFTWVATGAGGTAAGGGLCVAGGTAAVVNSTLNANTVRGGAGGNGAGGGGAITRAGAAGGGGLGGGLCAAGGTITLRATAVTANAAVGGAGGTGYVLSQNGQYVLTTASSGLAAGGLDIQTAASVGLDAFTATNTTGNTPTDILGSYARLQ